MKVPTRACLLSGGKSGSLSAREQSENDGSIGLQPSENRQRVMAREYSRELSVKVFAGQLPSGWSLATAKAVAAGYGWPCADRRTGHTRRVALSRGPTEEFPRPTGVVLVRALSKEQDVRAPHVPNVRRGWYSERGEIGGNLKCRGASDGS